MDGKDLYRRIIKKQLLHKSQPQVEQRAWIFLRSFVLLFIGLLAMIVRVISLLRSMQSHLRPFLGE